MSFREVRRYAENDARKCSCGALSTLWLFEADSPRCCVVCAERLTMEWHKTGGQRGAFLLNHRMQDLQKTVRKA